MSIQVTIIPAEKGTSLLERDAKTETYKIGLPIIAWAIETEEEDGCVQHQVIYLTIFGELATGIGIVTPDGRVFIADGPCWGDYKNIKELQKTYCP